MQGVIVFLIVCWASWIALGSLAPMRQRKLRAGLARRLEGCVPERFIAWLRPGFPKTGCGCHDKQCKDPTAK